MSTISSETESRQEVTYEQIGDLPGVQQQITINRLKRFKIFKFIIIALTVIITALIIAILVLINPNIQQTFYWQFAGFYIIYIVSILIQGNFIFVDVINASSMFIAAITSFDRTIGVLAVITSLLIFLSTQLRFIQRQFQSRQMFIQTQIQKYTDEEVKKNQLKQSINIACSNLLSAIGQITIFTFSFQIEVKNGETILKQVHPLILYLSTPLFFVLFYILQYTVERIQRKQKKKVSGSFVFTQILNFSILGLLCAGLLHLIFNSWEKMRIIAIENPSLPKFSPYDAFQLSFTICSFLITTCGVFALFVATPLTQILWHSFERNNTQSCQLFQKFQYILQFFISQHKFKLLSWLVVVITFITKHFSDVIQLGCYFVYSKFQNGYVSEIICYILLAVYIGLLSYQMRQIQHQQLFAWITFAFGTIAIPASLSTEIIQSIIVKLLPCGWRNGALKFLSNDIIPVATLVSFLQMFPMMFKKHCVPVNVTEREKLYKISNTYLKDISQQLSNADNDLIKLEKSINQEIENQDMDIQGKILAKIDFERAYCASKHASAPYSSDAPRITSNLVKTPRKIKMARKLNTIFQVKDGILYISFSGTRSIINLQPRSILVGFFDWLKVVFSPNTCVTLRNDEIAWGSAVIINKAKKVVKLLDEVDLTQFSSIVLCGHHQGACVGVSVATLLILEKNITNIQTFCFGMPHLISARIVEFVHENSQLNSFQPGLDGKLHISGILSEQLCWDSNYCCTVPYSTTGQNWAGYFAILNTGSTAPRCVEAMKLQADKSFKKETLLE